jgi:hypothetical protein
MSATRIAVIAAGVATAVAMEQATTVTTPTTAPTVATAAAVAGRFAAAVAMEQAVEPFLEAMAPTTFVTAAVAAAAATVVVITTATIRIRRRRRRRSRLSCGRWRIGAREPGRRYQQESSIHDSTSLMEFGPWPWSQRPVVLHLREPTSRRLFSTFQYLQTCFPGLGLGAREFAGLCHLISATGTAFL